MYFFLILVCEAIGTAATPGLLCHPRVTMKMIVEKQMECRLAGETEVLGENLPQRHFCPLQNPIWPDPGLNPGRRGGKPATNRLSSGAAHTSIIYSQLLLYHSFHYWFICIFLISTRLLRCSMYVVLHKTAGISKGFPVFYNIVLVLIVWYHAFLRGITLWCAVLSHGVPRVEKGCGTLV
jgi:hypothetical protein